MNTIIEMFATLTDAIFLAFFIKTSTKKIKIDINCPKITCPAQAFSCKKQEQRA